MRYKLVTVAALLLLGLGLTGCVGHLVTQDVLKLALQVSRGEAALADLIEAYLELESGAVAAASVDSNVLAVAQVLDSQGNGNGYLDGAELIVGIQYYASGQPIDGQVIDGRVLIGLIQLYAARTPLDTPTSPPPPSPTPAPSPSPSGPAAAFLALINRYRNQSAQCWDLIAGAWVAWPAGATQTLSLSPELTEAANYHSRFMADHDCFAHQCPGEPDLRTRIEQAGYTGWTFIGENIAAGMETPEEAFEAWRNSPGHNRNMLTCQFAEIGVARVHAPGSRYIWYWTTDFGGR